MRQKGYTMKELDPFSSPTTSQASCARPKRRFFAEKSTVVPKSFSWDIFWVLCLVVLASWTVLTGCGASKIPNTDVDDNSFNRKVIEFVEQYRKAVEKRDVGSLLHLASSAYLDDNGSPSGHDDIDYEGLKSKLAKWQQSVTDVRYEIRYRRVSTTAREVFVDYTYTASFRLKTADNGRWARRLADNRLVLTRSGETFRIVSGM